MRRDRVVDPLHHPALNVGRRRSGVLRQVPVGADRDFAGGAPPQPVAWLELANVAERARRGRDIAELEVGVERLPVEIAGRQLRGDQGFELGGEGDPPGGGDDVEGLDPQPVPGEQQGFCGGVPDGEGEHPTEGSDAARAELFVEVQHGLGVAP